MTQGQQPEIILSNPNVAPSVGTIFDGVGGVYATQLSPVGRATIIGQGNDPTLILLAPNGGCPTGDGANYPVILGYDTTQVLDSYGLSIYGSPGEPGTDDAFTYALSPNNTATFGFRSQKNNPRKLPYVSEVVAGDAIGIEKYGTYDYTDVNGDVHLSPGAPDSIVNKPRVSVLYDDITIKKNEDGKLFATGIAGSDQRLRPGPGIAFLPGTPPDIAPVATATDTGTGPSGSPIYALSYLTANGATAPGPASAAVDGTHTVHLGIPAIPPAFTAATGQILYRSLDEGSSWREIHRWLTTDAQTLDDNGIPDGAPAATTESEIAVELARSAGEVIGGLLEDGGDDSNGLGIYLHAQPGTHDEQGSGYPDDDASDSSDAFEYQPVGSGLRIDPGEDGGLGINLATNAGDTSGTPSGGGADGINISGLVVNAGDDRNGLAANVDETTITIDPVTGKLTALTSGGGGSGPLCTLVLDEAVTYNGTTHVGTHAIPQGSFVYVPWNKALFDSGPYLDLTDLGFLTVPSDGKYLISVSLAYTWSGLADSNSQWGATLSLVRYTADKSASVEIFRTSQNRHLAIGDNAYDGLDTVTLTVMAELTGGELLTVSFEADASFSQHYAFYNTGCFGGAAAPYTAVCGQQQNWLSIQKVA